MKNLVFSLLILGFSTIARSQSETLKISWPEEWKIGSDQKTPTQAMIEYIPKNEKIDDWTIMGTTMIFKGIMSKAEIPIETTMELMFNQAKKTAINPTLTLVEKKADGDNPWILFKIEAARFTTSKKPESQLFFVIEGKNDLYSNFVALKESTLSKEFVDHWAEIFKASHFIKE